MNTITRYLIKAYLILIGVILFGIGGLYLVIDFFEKIDDILEKKASFLDATYYFLDKIPFILTQGVPIAAFLAALILFGILQRNREIVALKAAGFSLRDYGCPIVVAAGFLAVAHFWVTEDIARPLLNQAREIWNNRIDKKHHLEWKHENIWYYGRGVIYQIRVYDRKSGVLQGVSIFYIDPKFRLKQRLDAARLYWQGNRWIAENGMLLTFKEHTTLQKTFSHYPLSLTEKPSDFAAIETLPEGLSWLKLHRYVRKIEKEGYTATSYRAELSFRLAFPFTTIILTLLGIAISLRQGLDERIVASIAVALFIGFLYLGSLQVGTALSSTGILPPFLGVWSSNLLFGAFALFLWYRTPQ